MRAASVQDLWSSLYWRYLSERKHLSKGATYWQGGFLEASLADSAPRFVGSYAVLMQLEA